jgi:methyl-accepting chemotaxis protein
MTVRLRIILACLVFICLCGAMAASSWRAQQRLGTLAIDLYDHAFVTQDFLGRANVVFERLTVHHADGKITAAERQGPLAAITGDLDIAAAGVLVPKTRALLATIHAGILALPALPPGAVAAAMAQLAAALDHAARRISNDGLAQRDEAADAALAARHVLLWILAAVLAAAAATGALLTQSVVPPLRRLGADMARLCGGDTDVVVQGTARRDEIGALCRSLGVFRQALLDNQRLEKLSAEQTETRRLRQVALLALANDFNRDVAVQLASVGGAVSTLQTTAGLMSERAARMTDRSARVGDLAVAASDSARSVTEAVSGLAATGREIAGAITQSAQATQLMLGEAEQARLLVDELGGVAASVGSVVALISGIAGKTNLLALNATIEAARAGEAGRGFAVVAGEVKALAGQTAQATKDIGSRIGAVRASADRAMALIRAMADRIAAVEQSGGAIADSVQRQGAAVADINHNLLSAAASIGEVATGMAQLQDDARENAGASSQVTISAADVLDRSGVLRQEVEYFVRATNEASDYRSFIRYACDEAVTLSFAGARDVPARLTNMSRGGAAIDCRTPLAQGATCIMEGLVASPLQARVIANDGNALRVQFSQADDTQALLAAFVATRFETRQAA